MIKKLLLTLLISAPCLAGGLGPTIINSSSTVTGKSRAGDGFYAGYNGNYNFASYSDNTYTTLCGYWLGSLYVMDNTSGLCNTPGYVLNDGNYYSSFINTSNSYPRDFSMVWRNNNSQGGATGLSLSQASTGTLSIVGSSSSQAAIRLNDKNNTKYTQIQSSNVVTTSYTMTLPAAPGTVGQIPMISEVVGSSVTFSFSTNFSTFSVTSGGSAGQAMCWKSATTLGYCSSVIGVGGACTCN